MFNKKIVASLFLSTAIVAAGFSNGVSAEEITENGMRIPKVLLPQKPGTGKGDNLGEHFAEKNLNMKNYSIINLSTNTSDSFSAVNMKTLLEYLKTTKGDNLGNHIATTILNMSNNKITNVADAYDGADGDAVNIWTLKKYLSEHPGDNMGNHTATQDLLMNDKNIYLGKITGFDPKTGAPIISGGVAITRTMISGLAAPKDPSDATNKKYVDDLIKGVKIPFVKAGDGITVTASGSDQVISVNNTVVRTTGNQNIGGVKTFIAPTYHNNDLNVQGTLTVRGDNPIVFAGNTSATTLSTSNGGKDFKISNSTVSMNLSGRSMGLNGAPIVPSSYQGAPIDSTMRVLSGANRGSALVLDTGGIDVAAKAEIVARKKMTSGNFANLGRIQFGSTETNHVDDNSMLGYIRFITSDRGVEKEVMRLETNGDISLGRRNSSDVLLAETGGRITNLADPQADQDAVNLRTLKKLIATTGDNLGNHTATTNLNLANNRIINVAAPVNGGDAVNKTYVDNLFANFRLHKAGDGISFSAPDAAGLIAINVDNTVVRTTGNQNVGGNKYFSSTGTTFNAGLGVVSDSNKNVVFRSVAGVSDATISTNASDNSLRLITYDNAGSPVSGLMIRGSDGSVAPLYNGFFNANNKKVVNVANPTDDLDGVNLRTLKAHISTITGDNLGNHTATTNINLSNNRIINVAAPTTGGDVTNKTYVDNLFAAAPKYKAGSGVEFGVKDAAGLTPINADNTVVRTTGNQNIAGVKTFTTAGTTFNTNFSVYGAGNRAVIFRRGDNSAASQITHANSSDTLVMDVRNVAGAVQTALNIRASDGAIFPSGNGFFHANSRKIISVADPTADLDAVNLRTLRSAYKAGDGLTMSSTQVVSVDNTVVRTFGDQDINGTKYFNQDIRVGNAAKTQYMSFGTWELSSQPARSAAVDTDFSFKMGGAGTGGRSHEMEMVFLARQAGNTNDPGISFRIHQPHPNNTGNGEIMLLDKDQILLNRDTRINNGNLDMTWNRVMNVGNPASNGDAVPLSYLNANYVSRTATQTVTGIKTFTTGLRVNPDPVVATDVVNLRYLNARLAAIPSDVRLKKDIKDISPSSGMDLIRRLSPKSYVMKDTGEASNGVIAQELQVLAPEMVKPIGDGMLGVDYAQMIAPMIAAIKDVDGRVSTLEKDVSAAEEKHKRILEALSAKE